VPALAALARATAEGELASRTARRELRALLDAPRLELPFGDARAVLYLNANLWFGLKAGGSVAHVAGVVNGLLGAGYAVDLYSASAPELIRPEAAYRPLLPDRAWGLPLERNYHRFGRRVLAELDASARGPYAFLYQRLSVASYAGVAASRRLRLPLVLEYNGSEVWAARHWGRPLRDEALAEAAEEASLRHAHLVVTVSEVLAGELRARGVEPERIVCHPNGVDAARLDPSRFSAEDRAAVRAASGITADATVAGFIGTFGQWHGVDLLARTIARLAREERPWLDRRRVRFLLVGDGLRMPEVQAALAGPGAEVATLPGLVPQADGPRYLSACDLLLSPHVPNSDGTPFFGSPTKLFEYMAAGKAVVASDLDQIGDVLSPALRADDLPETEVPSDGERRLGLLTAPGSERELAAGIRFLVERPAWRARLGANARAEALRKYTWEHHVGAILARVDELRVGTPGSP
jgi:glycosyltransferase involved in cell wall biosynthesis